MPLIAWVKHIRSGIYVAYVPFWSLLIVATLWGVAGFLLGQLY